jgi:hypothetical protein
MKKKDLGLLSPIGTTNDGKVVVSGVFKFFETEGLPLDMVLYLLQERGYVPCWVSFYQEASRAGMRHDRIVGKLEEALADTYDRDFKNRVLQGLEALFKARYFE